MKKNTLRLTATLLMTSLCLGGGISAAIADTASLEDTFRLEFQPPDEGLPSDTTGGASRDDGACAVDPITLERNVILLAPEAYLGLTAAARPEFFIQVDDSQAQRLFLKIEDIAIDGDYEYQAYQPLTSRDGVIALTLPEDAPDLEVGRTYRWSVAMVCGQRLRPDDPTLTSYVKRVDVSQDTAQLSAMERLEVYAESGIWYDSVALINHERQSNQASDVLAEAWNSLLVSGGLLNGDLSSTAP